MGKSIQLRKLRIEDEASFAQAVQAFEGQMPAFDFALHYDESKSFQQFVEMHEDWSKGFNLREGLVPSTFLIAEVEDQVVGR